MTMRRVLTMSRMHDFRSALIAIAWAVGSSPAGAQPLTPGNLLVSNLSTGVLSEYTPAGGLVRSFTFPDFEGGFHDLRDIQVSPDGNVHAYNGTFTPQMSTLVPTSGTITSQPFAGWSTVNNISYGGIGAFGTGVFVTDMATAGAGAPQGIVRFDTGGGTPIRFATAAQYHDLTVGGDGLLYALNGSSTIDVFNPTSMGFVRTITFDGTLSTADVRGIAVNSTGGIFAAAWNGTIYSVSSTGNLVNSRVSGFSNLSDIDLDNSGRLLVGSRFGNVILTDTTLASQTSFTLASGPTVHVAFTSPLTVPEPGSLVLCGAGALGFARWVRRRARTGRG
jgi:PEP-CTERM motif